MSRDSGTIHRVPARTTAATGTATRNTEPHQKKFNRIPLIGGPMAPPAPANAAQTATALGRSARGKITVAIDSVAGMTSAAASPMPAR